MTLHQKANHNTMKYPSPRYPITCVLLFISLLSGCSKNDGNGMAPNLCNGVNITVSATTTSASACLNNGAITVTASGSSDLNYSIDGRTFQASNLFTNLAKGSYTVTVKNADGCTKTADVTVGESGTAPGALFADVKQLVQAYCVSCHAPGGQQPTPNFTVDCNIVSNAARIRERAVVLGTMPPTGPLSQAEKDKINAWVAAGGKLEN
jgi:hypothetical protein